MFIIDLVNLGKFDDIVTMQTEDKQTDRQTDRQTLSNVGTKKEFGTNWSKLFKFTYRQNLFSTWDVVLLILTCICQFSEMKFVIHFFNF